jgi:hypothetical protein
MLEKLNRKDELQNHISERVSEYIDRYLKKIQEKCDSEDVFKLQLSIIPFWDDSKLQRETQKFLKWNEKSVNSIETLYINFIHLFLEIIDCNVPEPFEFLPFHLFFHNCFKRASILFYNNNSVESKDLFKLIFSLMYNSIPIECLLKSKVEKSQTVEKSSLHQESDVQLCGNLPTMGENSYFPFHEKLKQYEISDDDYNEYYYSEPETNVEDLKEIRLPKSKKPYYKGK